MWNKLLKLIYKWEEEQECLTYSNTLKQAIDPYIKSCSITTQQAIYVYKARADLPGASKELTRGYSKLLENLETFPEKSVFIHFVSSDNGRMLLFTDMNVTKLIGVLEFSEELWKKT